MMGRTHMAFGLLTSLVALPLAQTNKYIFISLVVLGSLLPDIDCPNSKISKKAKTLSKAIHALFGHRGFFHTIFMGAIVYLVIIYLTSKIYATPILIGFISHLIADGFTKSGINFLHPITTLRLHGFIETNSTLEHVFLAVTIILTIILII